MWRSCCLGICTRSCRRAFATLPIKQPTNRRRFLLEALSYQGADTLKQEGLHPFCTFHLSDVNMYTLPGYFNTSSLREFCWASNPKAITWQWVPQVSGTTKMCLLLIFRSECRLGNADFPHILMLTYMLHFSFFLWEVRCQLLICNADLFKLLALETLETSE